jgi:solute carrier family 35 protein E3
MSDVGSVKDVDDKGPLLPILEIKSKLTPREPTTCSDPNKQQALTPPSAARLTTACVYGVLNLSSSVLIVIANKLVLETYGFSYPAALTFLHMVFTAAGMACMAAWRVYEPKPVPWQHSLPMGAAFAASVALGNVSLQLNSVGFYQLTKLLVPPSVMGVEYVLYKTPVHGRVMASILILIGGGILAATADKQVSTHPMGAVVALISVAATALYQVWAGGKQKELELNGMQLLQHVALASAAILGVLVPVLEPVGWSDPTNVHTLLGYEWSVPAVAAAASSCFLGLLVTLSMFLFIGVTSPLTFNVMGHAKTLLIILSGVMVFQEDMPFQKLVGTATALCGIVWYSWLRMRK